YAPRLVSRIGHVRAFAALASLCSTAAVVHLLSTDFGAWFAMRLLAGFCFPGLYVISESWLNAKAANRSRASLLSAYFIVQTLGASLGQAMAGLDDPTGALLFGLASILISLSLVPLLISRNPAPDYVPPARMSVLRLTRVSPMGVMGAMLNGAGQAAIYVGLPLYGLAIGLGPSRATLLVVTATLAGAGAQFPAGWVSDRMDRRFVVGGLSIVCAGAAAALAAGLLDAVPFLAAALIGATLLPIYSLCVAYANDQLLPAEIVPASGALVLSLNIGILSGAFAGPIAVGLFGPEGLAWLLTLLTGSTAGVAAFRSLRTSTPSGTGTAHPIAVQGVQTTGAMHPDARDRPG
ncbi:MAG: MFS transporter, partial [Jannaschia sp.]